MAKNNEIIDDMQNFRMNDFVIITTNRLYLKAHKELSTNKY